MKSTFKNFYSVDNKVMKVVFKPYKKGLRVISITMLSLI